MHVARPADAHGHVVLEVGEVARDLVHGAQCSVGEWGAAQICV